jgi:acyl-CoA reductase-like NAD-dependent aldehyde dehydrogenase
MLAVDNPYSGEIVSEHALLDARGIDRVMERSWQRQRAWRESPLSERIAVLQQFCQRAEADMESIARDVTASMGKPIAQARAEVRGMCDRARQMCSIAESALADVTLPAKAGFERWIARESVGVVVVLAAWNYPLLIAINPIVAALLSGNTVVLKHSSRTPLAGDRLQCLFPDGLVSSVHCDHKTAEGLVAHPRAAYVSFTGSVAGGRRVYASVAQSRFIDVGLELGGKDPAYVRADANLAHAVENIVEAAVYNAGQSCCGVERVYVADSLYDRFLDMAVAEAQKYQPGDPMVDATTLGPMAQPGAPVFLRGQIESARGARVLCGGAPTSHEGRGRFFPATVVADVDQQLALMQEESFGPVLAVQRVDSDDAAIARMNDSCLGLTASVWTTDLARGKALWHRLEAGTVFLNRADYLDPMLAWTGVKDSGKGASLSYLGFLAVTRPKSFHVRLP